MKFFKNLGYVCLTVFVFLFVIGLFTEDIVNEGEQTYTLMVYMCGSDLESDGGYASSDISEMLYAYKDEKINIVMQTGCTNEWQDYDISSEENEIYIVENNELVLVETLNHNEMLSVDSLSNFIEYSKINYEADRYGLIMWDHGGGAISGFGYDETTGGDDTLTLDEIKLSLDSVDINFDFVGFDACLMATVETAFSLKGKSDYLVASEELEPGTGWNYTEIINGLSSNTDMETLELGKIIVDSFIESNEGLFYDEEATLSVINISKIDILMDSLNNYMREIDTSLLAIQEFTKVAKAIDATKAFGYGEVDTIDLYHLVENLSNNESSNLLNSISDAVEYNKTTAVMEDSNGLSVYIPYVDLSVYNNMISIFNNIGMSDDYVSVLSKIATTVAGGQIDSDYDSEDWYLDDYASDYEDYYDDYEYENLEIVDYGDYYVLELSEDDWEVINSITAEVLYDDLEGYIDLGSDNYYDLTEDGNLIVSFDGTWISIDGYIVPFYVIDEGYNYTKAKVPAYLNDELVDLIVVWDDKNPNGVVTGARPVSDYGETSIETRRLIEIKSGDKIEFLFDYYNYDLEYEDSYIIGEFIVSDTDFVIEYSEVGDNEFYVYYKIVDIYNNVYYTEAVIIY